MSVIQKNAIRN
jgi:hypothetical protein